MMSLALKWSTFMGVATKWYTVSSLCCYSLYSEAVLAIKNSRNVFMTAFYKTDSESFLFLSYGSHGHHTDVALDYVLSFIVLLFGVCILSSNLSIHERQRLSHVTIKIESSAASYIDSYEFNLTSNLRPILRLVVHWSVFLIF